MQLSLIYSLFVFMERLPTAVIDLGTNTFHLLIAQKASGGFTTLYAEQFVAKIGKGGINKGIITEEAYQRALQGLEKFKQKLEQYEVPAGKVFAIATSAIRNASNGPALVTDIETLTGIRVNIISGDEEAQLIYEGVKASLELNEHNSLIMDIGGGSVEYIICNKDGILWKKSFEIGAQRLLDRFMHTDPISVMSVMKLQEYVQEQLIPLTNAVHQYAPVVLIGASGAFDTLTEIYKKQQGLAATGSTSSELPVTAFKEIYEQLLTRDKQQRLAIPGMLEMRVDMIVVASCLIDLILENYNISSIRVSAYALKEGLMCRKLNS
jgi:exopolyphosphatase/guanosine-5'-triphosphate,3'-diphosphate pyrophosphatase